MPRDADLRIAKIFAVINYFESFAALIYLAAIQLIPGQNGSRHSWKRYKSWILTEEAPDIAVNPECP